MSDFDITCLPPQVQETLLTFVQSLLDAWAPAAVEPVSTASVRRARRKPQPEGVLAPVNGGTPHAGCAHGTEEAPCCAACAVVQDAEAVVAHVEQQQHGTFPRSAIELRILETLRQAYPLPLTASQIASLVGRSRAEVHLLCHALRTLDAIDRPILGHFRHKPVREEVA